jgi:serine/threonine protein kinase
VEDKKLVDFLQKLLEFSPEKRLTAKEALQHPYFEEFFTSDDLKIKK